MMPRYSEFGKTVEGMTSRLAQLLLPRCPLGNQGQDLIEYALMAGFVAVAVAAFIPYTVSGPISTIFTKIENFLVAHGNG
jgi:Flp pilus assembly pilin Flp